MSPVFSGPAAPAPPATPLQPEGRRGVALRCPHEEAAQPRVDRLHSRAGGSVVRCRPAWRQVVGLMWVAPQSRVTILPSRFIGTRRDSTLLIPYTEPRPVSRCQPCAAQAAIAASTSASGCSRNVWCAGSVQRIRPRYDPLPTWAPPPAGWTSGARQQAGGCAFEAADFRHKPLRKRRVRDLRSGGKAESTPPLRGCGGVRLQPRGVRGAPDCAFSTVGRDCPEVLRPWGDLTSPVRGKW
jgi:hypothetical protein